MPLTTRNNRFGGPGRDVVYQLLAVIAPTHEHGRDRLFLIGLQQRLGLRAIARLSGGHNKRKRIAIGIDSRMNLGGETIPGPSERLVGSATFLLAGSMLMGAYDARINHDVFEFRLLQRLEYGFPSAFFGPSAEASIDRTELAITLPGCGTHDAMPISAYCPDRGAAVCWIFPLHA